MNNSRPPVVESKTGAVGVIIEAGGAEVSMPDPGRRNCWGRNMAGSSRSGPNGLNLVVVPPLSKIQPKSYNQANQVRIGATNVLGLFGPDARDAIPELTKALHDRDDRFQNYAAEALQKIQGGEGE